MRYKLPVWESSPKLAPDLRSVVQQGTLLAGGCCGLICDSWPPFERARRLSPKLVLWCHQDNKTTILWVKSFYYYYHHYYLYYYYYFNQGLPNKFLSLLSSQRLTLMKLINSCKGQSIWSTKLYTSSFGSMIKLDAMSNLIKAGLLT